MFPKNKINIIYRLLCLISFIVVILLVNSVKSLIILFVAFSFFALCERNFKNIELIVVTLVTLGLSYLLGGYLLFRILLIIDYAIYFLDMEYYEEDDEDDDISEEEYMRFEKKKEGKVTNNINAIYLTVHLVILFIAILVG